MQILNPLTQGMAAAVHSSHGHRSGTRDHFQISRSNWTVILEPWWSWLIMAQQKHTIRPLAYNYFFLNF